VASGDDPDTQLAAAVGRHLEDVRARLQMRGLGARIGMGRTPAVLVVDLIRAFTDPFSPLGCDLDAEVAAARRLVDGARETGVPVILAATEHRQTNPGSDVWTHKIPANALLRPGSSRVELDDRLGPPGEGEVMVKTHASCFHGTDLDERIAGLGADTLVLAGTTTSGCIRATAVDACARGLRTIVVAEAVGDRSALSHVVSLFDLDLKYADVAPLDDVLDGLAHSGLDLAQRIPGAASA
jgi:maleamate amidohydrolase